MSSTAARRSRRFDEALHTLGAAADAVASRVGGDQGGSKGLGQTTRDVDLQRSPVLSTLALPSCCALGLD
jgi:hypothetical protein